jgi:hypothetical protein
MLLLAVIHLPQNSVAQLDLVAELPDDRGEQLFDTSVTIPALDSITAPKSIFSLDNVPANEPLASLPTLTVNLQAFEPAAEADMPSVGTAFSGRSAGSKKALLAAYGGTAATENSVEMGLEWLRRNQRRDGQWSLTGPYSNGAGYDNATAATAMSLLAFLGNGQTHRQGQHQATVARGVKAMLKMQDRDGNFFDRGVESHRLYSQAQATIATCELYGMTRDEQFREPAQRAIDYAVRIQADDGEGGGGWRYQPRQGIDTSVTGWFVMALQSGRIAGLAVPDDALSKVGVYLDRVTADGIEYRYRTIDREPRVSMTAEALLCRQYQGWSRGDARLISGAALLNDNPISWNVKNVYYWYYASQVLHHLGGDTWRNWNEELRSVLPRHQEAIGREKGSWNPYGDQYGADGGRLYFTCFCLYNLEVYYRHLPIYQPR